MPLLLMQAGYLMIVLLVLNARGNASIRGANGANGGKGESFNRDAGEKNNTAKNGGGGGDGTNGQTALHANTIKININIDKSGSLSLYGGNGGNGGNGGDGGQTGENEFQSEGGTPGSAGQGGAYGEFVLALSNCEFDINKIDGISGNPGGDGQKGTKS